MADSTLKSPKALLSKKMLLGNKENNILMPSRPKLYHLTSTVKHLKLTLFHGLRPMEMLPMRSWRKAGRARNKSKYPSYTFAKTFS